MELIFPWVLYIGLPVVIILPFLKFKNKDTFKKGKKVANVGLVEETSYYKKLMRRYKFFSALALTGLLLAIGVCFVMMSRPVEVETINEEIRNRDIFLCMDISSSVDELNLEICEEIRDVVKKLDGERIGITIFNAKSVLLVPLTTDYDYILKTLDDLEKSLEMSLASFSGNDFDYDSAVYNYKYEGTLSDYGSSFIGDGLASTLFNFPDLEENKERTRLIIFTTDNELNGTPVVTLEQATDLCAENDVKVYAVAPDNIVDEELFKECIESTGGEYYRASEEGVFDELVSDIEKTDASVMEKIHTIITDKPEALVICLVVCMGVYFLFSRKVKL